MQRPNQSLKNDTYPTLVHTNWMLSRQVFYFELNILKNFMLFIGEQGCTTLFW
jgi:hypothetical protein